MSEGEFTILATPFRIVRIVLGLNGLFPGDFLYTLYSYFILYPYALIMYFNPISFIGNGYMGDLNLFLNFFNKEHLTDDVDGDGEGWLGLKEPN